MMTPQENIDGQEALSLAHHDFELGLRAHAFYKLSNHGVGDELVQDTFLKTWRYLVRGGKIDVMKSFLYHVLNNLIVDEYRKHKTASLDLMLDGGFQVGETNPIPLAKLLDGKSALLLIQRLPVTYQKIMRMRYVQDLSLEEMALITGQTKNAMAVQAHRGLEKLKALYHAL